MRNPLLDKEFLKALDSVQEREVFAKIISLNFNEDPIEEITGKISQGSISIDGTSAVRRSCSLTLVAENLNINDYYWGLNTKFKLSVGLVNKIDPRYPDIIWFPQGTYLFTSFNVSQSANSFQVSLQGKDKMSLLNGDLGGNITAKTVDFGNLITINDDGSQTKTKILIKDIIIEAVHEYAKEPYHNIVVKDLDEAAVELMEYRGGEDSPLYLLVNQRTNTVTNFTLDNETKYYTESGSEISVSDSSIIYDPRIEIDINNTIQPTIVYNQDKTESYTIIKCSFGDVVGYRITDLTYAGELIGNVGDAVTSCCLDKIKNMLGSYEYFYNLDGQFVFQRKPTYVTTSWNNIQRQEADYNVVRLNADTYEKDKYFVKDTVSQYILCEDENFNQHKVYYQKVYNDTFVDNAADTSSYTYSFINNKLVMTFQNTPNLLNLKNDYSIWGTRKSASGNDIPVHLRYAIDKKPVYYKTFDGFIYLTQEEKDRIQNKKQEDNELTEEEVIEAISRFHTTALPAGLSKDWWEIDDWARRYLYLADTTYTHNIDYYLNLTGEEVVSIINAATQPVDGAVKDFNYYVYQLKSLTLRNFVTKWKDEDLLSIFPLPDGVTKNTYYTNLIQAKNEHKTVWAFLFDTALTPNGQEYIASIEHGYSRTADNIYPSTIVGSGCGHSFSYALNKKKQGVTKGYHSYIYDPSVPDEIRNDSSFIEKDKDDLIIGVSANYKVVEWREIIYQMALDYLHNQHNENFLSVIAANNQEYYPTGYTGYEQYYTDMQGFWRQLYDPFYTVSYEVAYCPRALYEQNPQDYYWYERCHEEAFSSSRSYYVLNLNGSYSLRKNITEETYNSNPSNYYYLVQGAADKPYQIKQTYYKVREPEYNEDGWSYSVLESPETINFWFDFLDTEGELSQYSVKNIGDRTKAENSDTVKSIYFREVPTVIFVKEGLNPAELREQQSQKSGYTFIQLPNYINSLFTISGQGKSAVDELSNLLYTFSYCAEQISISTLPIYYLEPNTRIFVRDDKSGINGEYIITRISLPLGHTGNMSISATKAVERIY